MAPIQDEYAVCVTDEELARMASQTVKELVSWSWCHRGKIINCKAPALVQKIIKFIALLIICINVNKHFMHQGFCSYTI